MRHAISRLLLSAAMSVSLLSVVACTPSANFVLPSAVGSELKEDFFQAYFPDFKKDMTWTYGLKTASATGESVWTVTDVTNGVATLSVKSTANDEELPELTEKLSKTGSTDGMTIKYQGTETLTLHGKEYKDAVKVLSTDKDGGSTPSWIAKGIGIIKLERGGTTFELKSTAGL
ncbi:hypothetical protein D3C72_233720 [compost metagenome]